MDEVKTGQSAARALRWYSYGAPQLTPTNTQSLRTMIAVALILLGLVLVTALDTSEADPR